MSMATFPKISRIFSNQQHFRAYSSLLDAAAFPIIGRNGPQVGGIIDCESLQPLQNKKVGQAKAVRPFYFCNGSYIKMKRAAFRTLVIGIESRRSAGARYAGALRGRAAGRARKREDRKPIPISVAKSHQPKAVWSFQGGTSGACGHAISQTQKNRDAISPPKQTTHFCHKL